MGRWTLQRLEALELDASKGVSKTKAAERQGLARSSFYRALENHRNVREAWERGCEAFENRKQITAQVHSSVSDPALRTVFDVALKGGDHDALALELEVSCEDVASFLERPDARQQWRLGRAQLRLELVRGLIDVAQGGTAQAAKAADSVLEILGLRADPTLTVNHRFEVAPTWSDEQFARMVADGIKAGRIKNVETD